MLGGGRWKYASPLHSMKTAGTITLCNSVRKESFSFFLKVWPPHGSLKNFLCYWLWIMDTPWNLFEDIHTPKYGVRNLK